MALTGTLNSQKDVRLRFEVLTAMTSKSTVVLDVTLIIFHRTALHPLQNTAIFNQGHDLIVEGTFVVRAV
jgi:hypothetical protein